MKEACSVSIYTTIKLQLNKQPFFYFNKSKSISTVDREGPGAKHSQRVDSLAERDIGHGAKVAFNTDGNAVCSSCSGKSIAQQVGILSFCI